MTLSPLTWIIHERIGARYAPCYRRPPSHAAARPVLRATELRFATKAHLDVPALAAAPPSGWAPVRAAARQMEAIEHHRGGAPHPPRNFG